MDDGVELGEALRRLVRDDITSYEELEGLLALYARKDEALSPRQLAAGLGVPEAAALHALESLHRLAFVETRAGADGPTFAYHPGSEVRARLVEELADVWARSPLQIVNLLSEGAIDRVRVAAQRMLAIDAGKQKP